jgi:NitT/TauT family transport system ATP-binding protein
MPKQRNLVESRVKAARHAPTACAVSRRLFPAARVYCRQASTPVTGSAKLISTQALVCAERVSVTYQGGIHALDAIDLEIPPGQFVSIVGPSGCGKSTLLRLLGGLIEPSSGSVRVAGFEPAVARRKAARLSFVFQDATLLPWRNVQSNVRLPLELAGTPRPPAGNSVSTALAMVGLAEFAGRFPNQLSGGMRMRASLARALVTQPELLLLDEPFAALDDITRQALNDELLRLWNARRWTGIFVTHNIAEAVYLSERILVMSPRPGRIVADRPVPLPMPRPAELRSRAEFARVTGEIAQCLRRAGT